MHLLILNSGSSSLKLQLIDSENWNCLYKGHVDGIGLKTCIYNGKTKQNSKEIKISAKDHTEACQIALKYLLKSGILKSLQKIGAVGHRVVHGGEKYSKPILINEKVIQEIDQLQELAPLHNPPNLKGILAAKKLLPKIPQVAVFDTGFYSSLPEKAYLYGLPYDWYKKYGVRRYGFHGTSHKYISLEAAKHLKKKNLKLITCHLGNGSSITAVKNGQALDTSMGFTPLEGVPMGTRSGDFDPSILYFLHDQKKFSFAELENVLNKKSGLLGISNLSSDIRILRDSWFKKKNNAAKRALDVFCYRIAKYIGSYAASLNGLDALIFTAGIGENAWYIRQWICEYLSFLNLKLDIAKNKKTDLSNPKLEKKSCYKINTKKSAVKILVIGTNEELQIAKETFNIIKNVKHF